MELLSMLATLRDTGGFDLHLVSGQPPVFRIGGSLERRGEPIDGEAMEALLFPHLPDHFRETLLRTRDVELTVRHEGRGYRLHVFFDRGRLGAAVRVIPDRVPTLDELGMGLDRVPALTKLTQLKRGLIVVTGPMGSGKSTLTAAMLEEVNRTRAERIITIENPIEYEFESKQSLITQRSIGEDALEYPAAIRAALGMDPDIVWISQLQSLEAMHLALTLAETGHLVFTTLHMDTASSAIHRMVESFPPGQKDAIRWAISRALSAVVAQKLLPRADGAGRVAAQEILIASPRVRQMILDGHSDLSVAIEAGRGVGMQTMDDSVVRHLEEGTIDRDTAYFHLEDKTRLVG